MDMTTDLPQHRFADSKLGYLVSSLSIPDFTEQLQSIKLKHNSITEGIYEVPDVIRSEDKKEEVSKICSR